MPCLMILSLRLKRRTVSLGDILFGCPNIESLDYSHEVETPWLSMEIDMILSDHLVLKSLTITDKTINHGDVNNILRRCPLLRNLYLRSSDFTVLQVIDASCPDINVVILNDSGPWFSPKDYFTHAPYTESQLKHLVVHNDTSNVAQEHQLMPLITKNKETLNTLVLVPSSSQPHTGTPPLPLASVCANRLTNVEFQCFPSSSKQNVVSFIKQCPLLSRVMFYQTPILESPEVFDALISVRSLAMLELYSNTSASSVDLERLVKHHVQLEEKSTLRRLLFTDYPGINDDVLASIASLEYLTDLQINGCRNASSHGLKSLVHGLKSGSLATLRIGDQSGFDETFIPLLGNIQSLKHLILGVDYSDSKIVTDCFIIKLLQNAPRLKSLTVHRCPNINNSIWEYFSAMETTTVKIIIK